MGILFDKQIYKAHKKSLLQNISPVDCLTVLSIDNQSQMSPNLHIFTIFTPIAASKNLCPSPRFDFPTLLFITSTSISSQTFNSRNTLEPPLKNRLGKLRNG